MPIRLALLCAVQCAAVLLVRLAGPVPVGEAAPAQDTPAAAYVCPPCGAECHLITAPAPGNRGVCGMKLVPLASVPQVGVLLQPRSALGSSLVTLAAFAGSGAVRAFSVADTSEPLRLGDALEVRPQFGFGDAHRSTCWW